jgi:protein phosphatase
VIPSSAPHLEPIAETHPGETGKNNEDRFFVGGYRLGLDETPVTLAVVADGIGGHLAGEVAAQVAVDTFTAAMAAFEGGDPVEHLRQAVIEAGRAVAEAAQAAPEREGMGSTLSAAWVIGARLYTATVGDSRIYLRRDNRLTQLSIDHTWVQEAIDHKIIGPAAARNHPHAHVLRRHLGSRLDAVPDLRLRLDPSEGEEQSLANQGHALRPGDQVLICSDGLTDLVEDYEIAGALRRRGPRSAVHYLVDLARARGGFDNITTLLLTVPGGKRRGAGAWLRLLAAAAISSLLLVLFVLAAVAGAWWLGIGPFVRLTPTAVAPSVTPIVLTPVPSATLAPTASPTPTFTPTHEASPTPTLAPSATATPSTETPASSATPAG